VTGVRPALLPLAIGLVAIATAPAIAGELKGPGRFCGYSPIIDLKAGERIVTLEGGIHGGTFRWEGAFGTLDVDGIGWAAEPRGRKIKARTTGGQIRFAQKKVGDTYLVAIWNGRQGAAYFKSMAPLSTAQLTAIDRVILFQEGEDPGRCDLKTIFSWDFE